MHSYKHSCTIELVLMQGRIQGFQIGGSYEGLVRSAEKCLVTTPTFPLNYALFLLIAQHIIIPKRSNSLSMFVVFAYVSWCPPVLHQTLITSFWDVIGFKFGQ